MANESRIDRGNVRFGFLTSSPSIAILPKPKNAKKMKPAPCRTPKRPFGANCAKLAKFICGIPMAMNRQMIAIFVTTKALLNMADCFIPTRFRTVSATIIKTAMTFNGRIGRTVVK